MVLKKVIYSLLGLLLGITGTVFYKKIATPSDDPYYFLEPKSQWGRFAETEIKLYQQGDSVDLIFWKTPIRLGRKILFFPARQPDLYLGLFVKQDKNVTLPFSHSEILSRNELTEDIGNIPMFEIKIYKINNDRSQTLLYEKIHRNDSSDISKSLVLTSLSRSKLIDGEIKIYKINNDRSQTLLYQKINLNDSSDISRSLVLTSLSRRKLIDGMYPEVYPYGQYRVNVKVLGNWPELKIEGLKYFIGIQTYVPK